MGQVHKNALDQIITNFETTYKQYLEHEGLQNTPLNRAAFFTMAQFIVEDDPIPVGEVQDELMERLNKIVYDAVEGQLDRVELIFLAATQTAALEGRRNT